MSYIQDSQQINLTKSSKILYNLLQIRIFDISQALQVAGYKFSINQIKQTLEKQYNIFGQVQKIYDQLKINYLYDIMKQISQNYVSIASILLDRKIINTQNIKFADQKIIQNKQKSNRRLSKSKKRQQSNQLLRGIANSDELNFKQKFQKLPKTIQQQKQQNGSSTKRSSFRRNTVDIYSRYANNDNKTAAQIKKNIDDITSNNFNLLQKYKYQKLGGIKLFNQNYCRGIQSLQKKYQALELKKKKTFDQKQLIKQLIYKQISDQADVQKLHQNDQISKFIKQGKIKHQLYNHIEYQKDLQSISLFLKQSQDDALKFLTDNKKIRQQQTQQTQQDIIINYHQLIQILALKKKNQYQLVQQKIKQIVDSFRHQAQFLQQDIWKKQQKIKQLQYKLKKKQGKQISIQTAGFKNKFYSSSNSLDVEEIEQQHKIVIEMFKKSLNQNQTQLLHLQTEVKSNQEKIKKKDTQLTGLRQQIEKLKKQLKQEKQQKKLMKKQQRNLMNSTHRNSVDEPVENLDKTYLQSVLDNIDHNIQSSNLLKSNKKRKPKHSIFGGHSNSLSMGNQNFLLQKRQDGTITSGFGQQKQKKLNSFANMTSVSPRNNFLQTKNNNILGNKNQQQLSFKSLQQNLPNNKLNKPIQSNLINQELEKNIRQQSKFKTNSNEVNLKKLQNQSYSQQLHVQSSNTQISLPSFSSSAQSFYHNKNYQNLLQKNSETLFRLIFDSNTIDLMTASHSNSPIGTPNNTYNKGQQIQNQLNNKFTSPSFDIDQQISKLKQFTSKYDQNMINSRLKKILSFINKYKLKQNQQIEEKNLSQEEEQDESQRKKKIIGDRYKQGQIKLKENKIDRNIEKSSNRTQKQKNSESDRYERQKQKIKGKLVNKKYVPSKNYLKKLHQQIRVSGKGFNLSSQQFLDICKYVQIPQQCHLRSSSYTSDQQNSKFEKYSNRKNTIGKSSKVLQNSKYQKMKQNSMYTQSDEKNRNSSHSNNQNIYENKNLLIQGLGMGINGKDKQQNKTKKQSSKCTCTCENHNFQQNFHHKNVSYQLSSQNNREPIISIKPLLNDKRIQQLEKQSLKNQKEQINKIINSQSLYEGSNFQEKTKIKCQIKQFYKVIKNQGGSIDSINKLEQMLKSSDLSLQDIIKITQLLKSQKLQDTTKLFQSGCQHHLEQNDNKNSVRYSHSMVYQCCAHVKKYSAFLQRLSLNEQSVKRIKKDIFALHIFNIDGKTSQKDFYKKNNQQVTIDNQISKKKITSKYKDLSQNIQNNKAIMKQLKYGKTFSNQNLNISLNKKSESLYKQNSKIPCQTKDQKVFKKQAVSVYIESTDKKNVKKIQDSSSLITLKKQLSQYLSLQKNSNSISNSFLPQLNNNNNSKHNNNSNQIVSNSPTNIQIESSNIRY